VTAISTIESLHCASERQSSTLSLLAIIVNPYRYALILSLLPNSDIGNGTDIAAKVQHSDFPCHIIVYLSDTS